LVDEDRAQLDPQARALVERAAAAGAPGPGGGDAHDGTDDRPAARLTP